MKTIYVENSMKFKNKYNAAFNVLGIDHVTVTVA